MVVHNDSVSIKDVAQERTAWNHTGFFGLINYSSDFYKPQLCRDANWKSLTLEKGQNAVIADGALFVGALIGYPAAGLVNLFWDPLTLSWTCEKFPDNSPESDDAEDDYVSVFKPNKMHIRNF